MVQFFYPSGRDDGSLMTRIDGKVCFLSKHLGHTTPWLYDIIRTVDKGRYEIVTSARPVRTAEFERGLYDWASILYKEEPLLHHKNLKIDLSSEYGHIYFIGIGNIIGDEVKLYDIWLEIFYKRDNEPDSIYREIYPTYDVEPLLCLDKPVKAERFAKTFKNVTITVSPSSKLQCIIDLYGDNNIDALIKSHRESRAKCEEVICNTVRNLNNEQHLSRPEFNQRTISYNRLYDTIFDDKSKDIENTFSITNEDAELLYDLIDDDFIQFHALFDAATYNKQYLIWKIDLLTNVMDNNWYEIYRDYSIEDFTRGVELISKINEAVVNNFKDFVKQAIK